MIIASGGTDFIVGLEQFRDLKIVPKPNDEHFCYFWNTAKNHLIKRFILEKRPEVIYECTVALIKKGSRCTPRLHLAIRDLTGRFQKIRTAKDEDSVELKASVSLRECHENFWSLISYLGSLREVDIPGEAFSLVSKDESEIVAALRNRDPNSIRSIGKQLLERAPLSDKEIHGLLKRKERLTQFSNMLLFEPDERQWQTFFNDNKWIFGFGLNYVILTVREQPNVGGSGVDGKGAHKPDFLGVTSGNVRFTVLVEIKTPDTPLLSGKAEIRSGAWSLSQDLTNALVQIQANLNK